MQLSIVIVNYNVCHFLEQCLCSVLRASAGIETEVLVIDNNSSDHSIERLQPRFPGVVFVANEENIGFARACNQGWRMSKGEYILFLNPDTIVPEDCFSQCIGFMATHPEAGALGIRMLDGSGRFLPESKRAFPSPMTSLFKLSGLARLFPHSRIFARYHLGHLDENKNHEVDVLAGAFMLVRRSVLEKTGAFEESFFMYGEDVDLSYRIQQAGFKNYYFAETPIIHFKGESTRKGSLNYVHLFYSAMSLFVKRHYGGGRAGAFTFLLYIAIWFRAAMTAIGNFIRSIGLPLIDAGLILFCFWMTKTGWSQYVRPSVQYDTSLLWICFPAFTVFFLSAAYYAGLYDRWYRWTELAGSTLVATISLLAAYALLPEQYRFSRGIILFGAILALLLISIFRWLLIRAHVLDKKVEADAHPATVVVGSPAEFQPTVQLMAEAGLKEKILGRVAVNDTDTTGIGYWKRIDRLPGVLPFRELIFCQGELSFRDIISILPLVPRAVMVKIHASGSQSIVGSQSKDRAGEFVAREEVLAISNPYNRRWKRLLDVVIALLALLSFPLQLILVKRPHIFLGRCISVLLTRRTWVGYLCEEKRLPVLRRAVIGCNGMPLPLKASLPAESLQMMDYWYARDYHPATDLRLIWSAYRNLGC